MNEDLTKNLPGSFEERVLSILATMQQQFSAMQQQFGVTEQRLDSVQQELTDLRRESASQRGMIENLHARMNSLESRLASLEDKVDARLRETRPIWEGVQQRLTGIEKEMSTLNRQFRTLIHDSIDVRSRVERLEDALAEREEKELNR